MSIDFVNEPGEWMDEWMRTVNQETDYDETGEGWGVDFNGDYIFEITPSGDLDEPIYNYAEVKDGEVLSSRHLSDDEVEEVQDEVGFVYRGSYDSWKELCHGEVGPIDGLMSGKFDLDGDMQKVLQYSDGAAELASASAQVDTEFPF